MAILDETPDVAIHRRPSGLCAIVQTHPYRSIGMAPSQVSAKNQEIWQRLYGHDGKGVPTFRVSNRVRISKVKILLEKAYIANWSEEIFTIDEVHASDPPVHRLIDDLIEALDETFYESERQKVSVPADKVYRVESVLQRADERRLW